MAELITQFGKACSNVQPEEDDVDNASKAHLEVRGVLEQNAELCAYGIDTILIGSYARHVSIRRVKDVDVFSKLPKLDTALTSAEVLELFMTALDGYGDRLDPQDRSIKIAFPAFGLHVDAVPARPSGKYWEVSDRPAAGRDDAWQKTNPEGLGDKSTKMNKRYDGNYVPVVKLVRQTRRAQLGDTRPGGLFLEILTYHAFDGMNADMEDANCARLYVAALRSVATQLADYRDGADIDDPSMPGEHISIRATDIQKQTAATKFAEVATLAENALADEDFCRSAKIFQDLLGKNDDGDWVFELPSYCNADGTMKESSAAPRIVPAGNERFA